MYKPVQFGCFFQYFDLSRGENEKIKKPIFELLFQNSIELSLFAECQLFQNVCLSKNLDVQRIFHKLSLQFCVIKKRPEKIKQKQIVETQNNGTFNFGKKRKRIKKEGKNKLFLVSELDSEN